MPKRLREITKTIVAPTKNVVSDPFQQQYGVSAGAATLKNRSQGYGHETNVPGTKGAPHPQTKFGTKKPRKKKRKDGWKVIDAQPKYHLVPKTKKKFPSISKSVIDMLPILREQLVRNQRTIMLPEDLGGVFPDTSKTIEERWAQVHFLVEHLANIKLEQTKTMIRALRSLTKR
jgi:hypothetical protein